MDKEYTIVAMQYNDPYIVYVTASSAFAAEEKLYCPDGAFGLARDEVHIAAMFEGRHECRHGDEQPDEEAVMPAAKPALAGLDVVHIEGAFEGIGFNGENTP